MYQSHKQCGRTRVHKVVEGKQHKKSKSQVKASKQQTPFEKIRNLQKGLLMEGMDSAEYQTYVQEKINNDKFFYKQLSKSDLDNLYSSFDKLVKKDDNQLNVKEDINIMKRKQRKNFRKQRKEKMDTYKEKLINRLFDELKKVNGTGVIKNTSHLTSSPDKWNETKNFLFPGGSYIEDSDKKWTSIYEKLAPMNSSSLFDVVYGSEKLQEMYLVC